MPALEEADCPMALTYFTGVPCSRRPKSRKINITIFKSSDLPFITSALKIYIAPIATITSAKTLLALSLSAKVVLSSRLETLSSSLSSSNLGSTEITALPFGCIRVLTMVIAAITMNTNMRLYVAKMVCEIGIACWIVPLETSRSEAPSVAIAKGMEAERPACQTTNPL